MMTAEQQGTAWGALVRTSKHRTSAPTDALVRNGIAVVTLRRGGSRKPSADAVLLAALRLADPARLAAEVDKIEAELHPSSVIADPPR
jgi:hypothetical protein